MNSEPVDARAAAVALRRRSHDGQTEPGARRAVGAARSPEALERVLGVLGAQAGAVVADGHERAVALLAHGDPDGAALGPVHERVLDQVAERASERVRVPADAHGSGCIDGHLSSGAVERELIQPHRLCTAGARGVLSGECEQLVEQARESRGVALDVGQHVGVGAVLCDVRGIAPQRGERGPQLVRGIGDEAALGLARLLERGEHRIERLRQRADLVARVGRGQPARRVARLGDRAGGGGEVGQRPQRPAGQQQRDSDCEHRRGDRGQQYERPQPVRGVLVLLRARGDEHGAAGRRPGSDTGERRAVEAHGSGAEPGVGVVGAPAGDHAGDLGARAEHAPAERSRARDDAPAAIDDLDEQPPASDASLERTGRRQQRRRGRAQLGNLRRPGAQCRVARRGLLALRQRDGSDAEQHGRERDRGACRQRDAHAQACRLPHGSSTNPTPRTVRMSGGSPSFRRR